MSLAETPASMSGAPPAIILVEPQMGENIGAAARAMANFGLSELRLVAPRDGWPSEKARANAAGAGHVVDAARIFATLGEAVADLHLLFATTARERGQIKPVLGPDAVAARLASAGPDRAGILFGRERSGLTSDEVGLADAIVTLPVDPAHASLNIAQAVLILAYEWRKAGEAGLPFTASDRSPPATREEVSHLFAHLEGELDAADFFRPVEKRPTMVRNLRNILLRMEPSHQDVQTLRGVIVALTRRRPGRGGCA